MNLAQKIAVIAIAILPMAACNNNSENRNSQTGTGEKSEVAEVKIVTKEEFDKAVAANENVLIDFYATWCGPCRQLEPNIVALQKQQSGKLKIYRIDVDEASDLAKSMNVSSIPHLLYYKNGQVKKEVLGYQSTEQLQADASTIFSLN